MCTQRTLRRIRRARAGGGAAREDRPTRAAVFTTSPPPPRSPCRSFQQCLQKLFGAQEGLPRNGRAPEAGSSHTPHPRPLLRRRRSVQQHAPFSAAYAALRQVAWVSPPPSSSIGVRVLLPLPDPSSSLRCALTTIAMPTRNPLNHSPSPVHPPTHTPGKEPSPPPPPAPLSLSPTPGYSPHLPPPNPSRHTHTRTLPSTQAPS